jgi:hypothetical protein
MHETLRKFLGEPVFAGAYRLQVKTIKQFHALGGEICGDTCPLDPPDEEMLSVDRNFFSTFFLAITERLIEFDGYLPLYAMTNQALRTWLTSIDNILDDEYKEIFRFAGTRGGNRIRSAMALLLADRVIQEYIARQYADFDILSEVGMVTIRALAPTALAAGNDTTAPSVVLPAEAVAEEVHARKTIELFLAPLSMPTALEEIEPASLAYARNSLTHFGQGCQILDDLRDMPEDICARRHNFMVSLLSEAEGDGADVILEGIRSSPNSRWTAWQRFGKLSRRAAEIAMDHFRTCYANLDNVDEALTCIPLEEMVALLGNLIGVPEQMLLDAVNP